VLLLLSAAACLLGLTVDVHAQSLRGSRSAVRRAHRYATAHDLHFHRTSRGVRAAAARGRLARLRTTRNMRLHNVSHPYARPMTALFLERLSGQYRRGCGERLVVTSATRPLAQRLPNASRRSVHPTGTAVDLRRPDSACLRWLRRTLLQLERRGVLDATEERRPAHFHVMVFAVPYRRYLERMGVEVAQRTTTANSDNGS
jgi:hypothetical protein